MENSRLSLCFDRTTGTLAAVENKLSGEIYRVRGDECSVEAVEFSTDFADLQLVSLDRQGEALKARYQSGGLTIEVTYTLHDTNSFIEKQLVITSDRNCGLRRVVLSRLTFPADVMPYLHPKLGLNRGAEPSCTYFVRTAEGGVFAGVEIPFDGSSHRNREVTLAYAPNVKVAAGETLVSERMYLGVYRRGVHDKEQGDLPMQSESEAMVAMTSAVLPPPSTPRLGPVLCGWWSEMWRKPYRTIEDVERDMRSIDFAVECGIDIVADARVWAGEPQKVSSLRNDEKFELGELPRKLAEYARRKGVRWMFWASMGNSEPWCEQERMGKPFRPDKPEWLMTPYSATCFGYRPSFDWLAKTILDAMEAGQYGAWSIDGDFFGGPGFDGGPGWNGGGGPNGEPGEPWVHPARCESKLHDHVNPDINCICQRHLTELARILRQRYPDVYTFYSRPTMDLGVWALRHVDACWTINEWAGLEGIPGMEPQPKNVLLGDKIRHWSRMRVHQHFFPHYLDSSLVFDAPKSMLGLDSAVVFDAPQSMPNRDWTSEKIDYIMLSALSSSPNQIFYLPSQAGIPAADKREIKKWLDWGRANLPYIMVRKDLPDWPAPGKVDGSAHIVGRQGLVFLFNPNKDSLPGEFSLSEESIGLKGDGAFRVSQSYPTAERTATARYGETIRWDVPGQTAVILDIQPAP
ncbi:MAG: hypothetical protein GX548_11825 [Lentisphaerae bacterium]|nr:hypothetical protein [Lentisphaerota bacterium]